jgi:hypothetical protein
MSRREQYAPGAASGAEIRKDGERRTLVLDPRSPTPPDVGPDAMKFSGWPRLNAEYAKQFGVETPGWSSPAT